ncbi:unnamed protein product [Paramecium octaurelia]|uniref:Protein kinase domain-containing protein n=1 Tax=Paramecium octaurelia TaxID=43137 RepID=A0A8S1XZ14_PAROT|nr:unnamed protein product [Paramecium octaurelia]
MTSKVRVGHYLINTDELLGKGSFGAVYSCQSDTFKNKDLCVKIVSCKNAMIQAHKEIELLEVLKKVANPNLIMIHDLIQDENQIYIFMDRCRGGDLKSLILDYNLKKKQFTLEQIVDMVRQIVCGYEALIQNKMIHRDLKPANILFEYKTKEKITLKLTDFGLGRILDDITIKQYMTRVGTPAYMSPQISLGEKFSAKCDIFSLGIIIYELTFLELPSQGMNPLIRNLFQKSLKTKPFVCPNLNQQQPAQLKCLIQDLINKMLSFEEEARPSWEDLIKSEIMTIGKQVVTIPIEVKQKNEENNLQITILKYERKLGRERYFEQNQFFKLIEFKQKFKGKHDLLRKSYLIVYMMICKAQLLYSLQQQFQLIVKQYFPNFDVYHFELIQTCFIGYRFKILENAFGFCNQKLDLINESCKKQFENEFLQMTQQIYQSNELEVQTIKKHVYDFFLQTKDVFQQAENELINLKTKNQYPKNIEKFFKLISQQEFTDFGIYAKWFYFFWNQHLRKLLNYDQTKQHEIKYQLLLILIERFLNLETDHPFQKYDKFDENSILLQEKPTKDDLERQIKLRVYI